MNTAIAFEASSVVHSKRRIHNRREIDITLAIRGDGRRTVLLVENKLDTSEQPFQAESYRSEAESLISHGEADVVFIVLVAPEAYAATAGIFSAKFDCLVTYEAISEFMDGRVQKESGELKSRLQHRHNLIQQAITKARRGYQSVPMVQIEAFNAKYVTLLGESGIDLKPGPSMLKEGRPGESKTMIFAPEALPKWPFLPQTRLVHQLREGNANVNFYGWGKHFSYLATLMAPALVGTPYRPVPTINKRIGGNSGLMIVADTPKVDNLLGFDVQREVILQGMRVTAELCEWVHSHKKIIEAWAEKVAALS